MTAAVPNFRNTDASITRQIPYFHFSGPHHSKPALTCIPTYPDQEYRKSVGIGGAMNKKSSFI